MPLIQGKGGPIPEVPLVGIQLLMSRVGCEQRYLLVCGHHIAMSLVSSDMEEADEVPCRRCWEALLGTEDAE